MNERYPLYGGTPPHEPTDTSRAAALMAESRAATVRANILRTVQLAGGYGKTDDEIETLLGLRHQTASARRRELVLLGLLRDSGNRRLTRGKRYATVWVTTVSPACSRGTAGCIYGDAAHAVCVNLRA